ncbi:MAG: 7-cyano-7-deazaguanine synthase QueC, partial [Pseudoalteromonas sp.]
MTQKVVVIYSGGMDSFTVLNKALQQGCEVYALSFDYGQRHVKELKVAADVCKKLGVAHKIVDISAINQLIGGSSLTDDIDVPEGHYEAENMKSTIVPNRNMILLSLAVGYAVSLKASKVYYGAHSGDHAIYPDCRPEFVEKMDDVCRIANYDAVEIFSPYLNNSKIDILTDGIYMGLVFSQSWSCFNGRDIACGICGA